MTTVFISHSREHSKAAELLAERLTALGAKVWLDTRSLDPGEPFEKGILRAVQDADAALVFVGEAASRWHELEIAAILHEARVRPEFRVVPIVPEGWDKLLPEVPDSPYWDLSKYQCLYLGDALHGDAMVRLLSSFMRRPRWEEERSERVPEVLERLQQSATEVRLATPSTLRIWWMVSAFLLFAGFAAVLLYSVLTRFHLDSESFIASLSILLSLTSLVLSIASAGRAVTLHEHRRRSSLLSSRIEAVLNQLRVAVTYGDERVPAKPTPWSEDSTRRVPQRGEWEPSSEETPL